MHSFGSEPFGHLDAVVVIVVRLVFAGVWAVSLRCSAFVLEVIITIVEVVIVVEVPAGIVVVIAIVEISAGVVIAVVIIAVVEVVIIVVIGDLDFVGSDDSSFGVYRLCRRLCRTSSRGPGWLFSVCRAFPRRGSHLRLR